MESNGSSNLFESLLFELLKKIDQFTEQRIEKAEDRIVEGHRLTCPTLDLDEKISPIKSRLKMLLDMNDELHGILEAKFSLLESKIEILEKRLEAIIWAIKQLAINCSLDSIVQPACLPGQARHA